jgi:hypothetical protein
MLAVMSYPAIIMLVSHLKEKKTGKYDSSMSAMPLVVGFLFFPMGLCLGVIVFFIRLFL